MSIVLQTPKNCFIVEDYSFCAPDYKKADCGIGVRVGWDCTLSKVLPRCGKLQLDQLEQAQF